ncbi:ferric reductase-like transmembrane domain-containing protein [bacterium]|nr:ferric reductase-like transmembrane domain-containing protein [bacterium]
MEGGYLKKITWSAGAFWILTYLLLIFTPIFILLIGEQPAGKGFWWDLSIALGFAGLTMVGVQFFLTARFHGATAPFGIDIIYYFHRYLAIFAFVLLFAHPVILILENPALVRYLNPAGAPWHMTAGFFSLLLFAGIISSSLWRKQLKLEYDWWRLAHGTLATAAVILALVHIVTVGEYTGTHWKKILWSLFIFSWVFLLIYIRLIKPWFILKKPYVVVSVAKEPGNIWVLTVRPDGHQGLSFIPGQFAWLTLRHSPFMLKEHPFSISSSATDPSLLEFTIREFGDFTRTIKDILPGEVAYIDGPYGAFSTSRYHSRGFVFISGGIGITPIMCMLRTLADRHEARPILLFDCNRNWDNIVFREELDTLRSHLNLKVTHILEEPPENWKGETGFLTRDILEKHLLDDRKLFDYFLCGPEPMTKALERVLYAMGVPLRRSHTEIFDLV